MSGGAGLHIDVLGPIRVRDAAGQDLTPDGALQRRLLATARAAPGPGGDVRCGHRRPVARRSAPRSEARAADPSVPPAEARSPGSSRPPTPAIGSTRPPCPSMPTCCPQPWPRRRRIPRPPTRSPPRSARWRGPAYPELADDRRRPSRGHPARGAAHPRDGAARRGAPDRRRDGRARGRPARPWSMSTRCASVRARCSWRPWPPRDGPPTPCGCSTTSAASSATSWASSPQVASPPSTPRCSDGSSVAAWTPPHRLPVAATSLLGRDDLVRRCDLPRRRPPCRDARRAGRSRQVAAGASRSATACATSGRLDPSCSSSWRPPRPTRPSKRSRPRWPSTVGRAWGSTIASPPCSATSRWSCCSTTASTSSNPWRRWSRRWWRAART